MRKQEQREAAHNVQYGQLVEMLREVTATLAWVAHGECRAVHDGPILSSNQAQEKALALLAQIERTGKGGE